MKLLVSDLDGTLYPKGVNASEQLEKNIAAVQRWVASGNEFAVATARGLHHYQVIADRLGLDINFIGGNGAIVRLKTGESIVKQLPCSVFIDLCRYVLEKDLNVSIATGLNDLWTWSSNRHYPRGVAAYDSIWDSVNVANLDEIDPAAGIERIQIFVPKDQRDEFKEFIVSRNYPGVVTTSDLDMIDIGPLNSSKGISIKELCERFKIDEDQLIVAGDSENDIPMFNITKHSYCMDCAEPNVIKSASRSAKSVEEVIELELA